MNNTIDLLLKVINNSAAYAKITFFSAILLSFAWHFQFSKKKYLAAWAMLGSGLIALGYLNGILAWASGLGGDSFLEIKNFNSGEAFFWVSTFASSISRMLMPLSKTTLLVVMETLILSGLLYLAIRWRPVVLRSLILILLASVLYFAHLGYTKFELERAYLESLQQKFDSNPTGFNASDDIDLFVYIGESTSSLNMSLYGYPLNTTPLLDALYKSDAGFVRFDKVRSTHTHTSASLLRALAVTSLQKNGRLIQWGIGSVLKQSGLTPHLYSVQPRSGSFATFSPFVFDGFDAINLPAEDQYRGGLPTPRAKDHQLLETALQGTGVVFFHSYAGHGPYLDLIEPSKSNVISVPAIRFDGIYGSQFSQTLSSYFFEDTAAYDRAITYIDRNVEHAIDNIKVRHKPAVMIYFSDHGDAVYAKRGHESSKFINEMSTVPMVLYFNDIYRKKYPDIYAKYKKASLTDKTKFLDQVSPTILDILRIHSLSPLDVPTLASSTKHPRPYIVERDTVSGPSRIDFEYDPDVGFSIALFSGGTPEPTYISIINEKFGKENTICYHRSDSFAKALRGAAVADCLEFDLVVDGDQLNVYHPPATATGFSIEHVFSIAQARKSSLWIDSKNLSDPSACTRLALYIEGNHARVGQILVEFPWETTSRLIELNSCGKRLRSAGARTSYYIPSQFLIPCAEDTTKNASACDTLNINVKKAMASGIFSDLSFDFRGYLAMKRIKGAEMFTWNTWTIKAKDFHIFPRKDFGFVILDTSTDPNTY